MAVANPNINPLAELGAFLPGDALERLAVLLAEPDARHTCGQLARLGAAFSSVGASFDGRSEERDARPARRRGTGAPSSPACCSSGGGRPS